jgi:hypothetical protein
MNPRDIVRREGVLYVIEQVVEMGTENLLNVRELDGDRRWCFSQKTCELIGRRMGREQ